MAAGVSCWYCSDPNADVYAMAGEQRRWMRAEHFEADDPPGQVRYHNNDYSAQEPDPSPEP